jgi:hypothetical protein
MSALDESDLAILAQLREHGDDANIPRPIFIWIYGLEDDLKMVAARLSAVGWQNVDPEPVDDEWVVRAEREQTTAEAQISSMIEEIYGAMDGTGANFDGWETSVERSN